MSLIERVVAEAAETRIANKSSGFRKIQKVVDQRPMPSIEPEWLPGEPISDMADQHVIEEAPIASLSPALPAEKNAHKLADQMPAVCVEEVAPAQQATVAETSQRFSLDVAQLEAQGFFVPSEKPQRLAQELRAVKRRLLRRLNFYRNVVGADDQVQKKERQANTVLVTSTRPAEGKTFTAINLALSLALEDNINVLLIDTDVPRPMVFTHLGITASKGLTDCLVNPDLPISQVILREQTYPLSVISQGMQKSSPTSMFSSVEMENFIEEVSRRYPDRVIIFDAPPVLATPEASIVAKYVDEVLFVVEANATPEPAVVAALDELLDSTDRISLVLNNCRVSGSARKYGSYDEYYYKAGQRRGGNRSERQQNNTETG